MEEISYSAYNFGEEDNLIIFFNVKMNQYIYWLHFHPFFVDQYEIIFLFFYIHSTEHKEVVEKVFFCEQKRT
jgi:hypothetical protein